MAALNRLQQRIKENFHETTRDLSLLTGTNSSSTSYLDASTSDDKLKEISKLLESRIERERLEGMKRIVAGISKGRDMESFFAQVVKNVVSPSIEIRKLVYIYLLRFASTNSDLLLLSINTFQKDLSDASPLIRSMSLRVLTSIRVPVIQGIVMLGLKKLVNDRNPYVRKTVAGGLSKVYEMDPSSISSIIPLLQTLLASPSPLTLGPSLTALLEICPDRLDLLHPYFRHIARLLVDADEWGQVVALHLLTRYARTYLEQPVLASTSNNTPANGGKLEEDGEDEDEFAGLDDDLAMLLHCSRPLFQGRNAAVVLETAKMFYHLAPVGHELVGRELLVRPMFRLAEGAQREEVRALSWEVIGEIVDEQPELFKGCHSRFYCHSADSLLVRRSKINALIRLVSEDTAEASMREFKHYVRFSDDAIASLAVRAIGHCVRTLPNVAPAGLSALMRLLKSRRESLVGESVLVLQSIILSLTSSSTTRPQKLVARLAKQLDGITNARARASVFWLVGQYAASEAESQLGQGWEGVVVWAPDVLRKGVKGFTQESTSTKLQILTLATKLLVLSPNTSDLRLMTKYLFGLARYDADYDVRDRGRFLYALLRGVRADKNTAANGAIASGEADDHEEEDEEDLGGVVLRREQVKVVLLSPRTIAEGDIKPGGPSSSFEPATLSRVLGRRLADYAPLPVWTDDPTDSSLRDSYLDEGPSEPPIQAISSAPLANGGSTRLPVPTTVDMTRSISSAVSPVGSAPRDKAKFQDLDKFLDSASEEESEEEDETDSEEEVAPRAVTAPPRRDILPEYDEGSDSSEEEDDEEEQESEEGDGREKVPLYGQYR